MVTLLLPEISIFLLAVIFLFISIKKNKSETSLSFAKFVSIIPFVISIFCVSGRGLLFSGAYSIDLFSQLFKVMLAFGFCVVVFMLENTDDIEREYVAEYFMFLAFSVLGLMMLVSSVELISIVIALEVSSYSLYVVVPLRKGHSKMQWEAAIKYLFFGAISTGVMLYGMSFIYAACRSTFLADIVLTFPTLVGHPLGIVALIMTLSGFFFKLSLFPFHFWAPDIYEGASNVTTTFIATIPKIAGAALLIRFTMIAPSFYMQFVNILVILAALSMTFGNIVGLVQKDVKRLLAYSGIAHAGYLLMGVLALTRDGNAAAVYYIAIYLLMNLACLYVVVLLANKGENVELDDLMGLSRRAPVLALTLAVAAFSLAGIPPTGGFTGKLFLFTSAFKQGHLTLVIIGAVNTVISIFYYLNLVRMSYSKEAPPNNSNPIKLTFNQKMVCYVLVFMILYMGILPKSIFGLFKAAL
ncbi:MAG: NADH-quinone oxidoreductase subunit N [Syntrophobacterales bacterium]|nr:NADH-quinone oxidoreductase subunit N [Syntrophobacterales bacterium]